MEIKQAKKLTDTQIADFVQLIHQLNPNSPAPDKKHLEQVMKDENTALFIIEEDGRIYGTLSLVFYRIPTGTKAWIEDVIIDASLRGRGFGKQIMNHAITYAQNVGARKIYLTSNPSRIAANQMYQSMGFEQYMTNMYFYTLD